MTIKVSPGMTIKMGFNPIYFLFSVA